MDGLTRTINSIVSLSQSELQQISANAVDTAKNLTDYKVAEHYIKSIDQNNNQSHA